MEAHCFQYIQDLMGPFKAFQYLYESQRYIQIYHCLVNPSPLCISWGHASKHCLKHKAFLHYQAGTVAAWYALHFHYLAFITDRAFRVLWRRRGYVWRVDLFRIICIL